MKGLRWATIAIAFFAAAYFGVRGYLDQYWLGYVLAAKWTIIGSVLFAVFRP